MQQQVTVSGAERVAFIGSTGSGKTTLAAQLTAPLERLIVIDPKGTLGGKWNLQEWNYRDAARALERGDPIRVRVPLPVTDNPISALEPLFALIYDTGGVTVYIDELYGVVPPGKKPGAFFSALYTRGREFEIGVWAATQRPKLVPLFCLSESEWAFLFRLRMEDDRKRCAEFMGDTALQPVQHKHGFYMFNSEWDAPVYCAGLELPNAKGDTQ